MTKIDIFSGFLGAGKTTLIKKLIAEAYSGEKLVLIENEFGEIGIDGGFLEDAGINITEMNSGCICCSLVGDFGKALQQVLNEYHPDRILIEPSGVGKLSDVIRAVAAIEAEDAVIGACTAVVDAAKCKMYAKNFGEFFLDQIESASTVVFSHQGKLSEDKLNTAVALVREHNPHATLVTTSWDLLDGKEILAAMEKKETLDDALAALAHSHHEAHHHHEDECDDPECSCHHHEEEHHHHHHHEDECDDPECSCHHHGKGHHHHHADEVFRSLGAESAKRFSKESLESILTSLSENSERYGTVLRAKGIVPSDGEGWLHFDYVPGEGDVRQGSAAVTGRLCIIGSKLNKDALEELFGVTWRG